MRRLLSLLTVLVFPLVLSSCDSLTQALNVVNVKFTPATPVYTGPDISYTGGLIPHLSDFQLVMTFHVNADNTQNSQRAAFGSPEVPISLNFYVLSLNSTPIQAPIPSFSVAGGADTTLDFPVSIPLSDIANNSVLQEIVAGDSIPYFLTGTIGFSIPGIGSGSSTVDLATGGIPTRPSGSVVTLLSGLI
ncbi:MAG TPA: LEA type 2 family protein [Fibrobacteria bacterium]|nr:LEA type 2 family protein [Fibrobacteria bacterium]